MSALQTPRTYSCTKTFQLLFLLYCSLAVMGCSSGSGESAADLSSIASDNATLSAANNLSGNSSDIEAEGQCELSILDEGVLRLLNEVRAEARMCGDISYEAVAPVVWNCTLEGAAESHSLDMGNNNFFNHTGSDGLRVGARSDAAGYDWLMVGENIAVGYQTAQSVINAWLASPSHCSTIMTSHYTETATSVYLPQGADYSIYWTLLMAKPSS